MKSIVTKFHEQELSVVNQAFVDLMRYCNEDPEIEKFVQYALGAYVDNKNPLDLDSMTCSVIQSMLNELGYPVYDNPYHNHYSLYNLANFIGFYFFVDGLLFLDHELMEIRNVDADFASFEDNITQNPKEILEFAKQIAQRRIDQLHKVRGVVSKIKSKEGEK